MPKIYDSLPLLQVPETLNSTIGCHQWWVPEENESVPSQLKSVEDGEAVSLKYSVQNMSVVKQFQNIFDVSYQHIWNIRWQS